jgi:Flp pilus assembly pilin Flp
MDLLFILLVNREYAILLVLVAVGMIGGYKGVVFLHVVVVVI